MAACFRLMSPLDTQEKQEEPEQGYLMVMADPLDHGHGKKGVTLTFTWSNGACYNKKFHLFLLVKKPFKDYVSPSSHISYV